MEGEMKMETARDVIRTFLTDSLDAPDLGESEDIFAAGLVGSMFALQLVEFVESRFEIEIENEDLELENFNSVLGIVRLVERKRPA